MRIAGSYQLPFDRQTAYNSLHDPALLARCLPECDAIEKIGEDEYAINMKISLASFAALFTGKIKVTEANPPRSFKIRVEGWGLAGFLKGEGLMSLNPAGEGTEIVYDGDVQVGGPVAAAGQRSIDAAARTTIRKFFEKFVAEAAKPA